MEKFISRRLENQALSYLKIFPAVLLTGARQVGKTTLAKQIAERRDSVLYDLDEYTSRMALADPADELLRHKGKLIIIDEVQRIPGLFQGLRHVIDETIYRGGDPNHFILLGSVTESLQRQSERLPGRLDQLRLHGLDLLEVGLGDDMGKLWNRGGFPKSYLADSDAASMQWRKGYIRNQLAVELAMMNIGISPDSLARLLGLLSAIQGKIANKADLATSMKISQQTVGRHIRLLEDLMLISKLPPYSPNLSSRHVKSPKYYVCDSGLMNALNNFNTSDLHGNQAGSLLGASWEGFAIESIRSVLPQNWRLYFFRTDKDVEMDCVIELEHGKIWAAEIKHRSIRMSEGNKKARKILRPERTFLVHGREEAFTFAKGVEAVPLAEMMKILLSHHAKLP